MTTGSREVLIPQHGLPPWSLLVPLDHNVLTDLKDLTGRTGPEWARDAFTGFAQPLRSPWGLCGLTLSTSLVYMDLHGFTGTMEHSGLYRPL